MTPEQKTLVAWSGGLAGVLLVGWLVLDMRGETFSATQKGAAGLIRRYDSSHPAKGKNSVEARKQIKQALAQQESALAEAESALVPPLPEQFTNPEISAAEGTIREAINQLEQKAQRQNVKLADLPFKNAGLDPKSDVRRMQLAQVYLYCGVLDTCIEAGVNAVSAVRLTSSGTADPSETYALLTCDVELEAKWKGGTNQLLADLLTRQNRKGYGVRNLEIAQNEDGTQRVRLTASLLTRYDPTWGLKNEAGARTGGAPPAPKKLRRSTDDNT
jgi:hypothetical protein